jgi:hypothetical protein
VDTGGRTATVNVLVEAGVRLETGGGHGVTRFLLVVQKNKQGKETFGRSRDNDETR